MSPGRTEMVISKGAEDICEASQLERKNPQSRRRRETGSEYVKSPQQFFPCFHGEIRAHSTEHFYTGEAIQTLSPKKKKAKPSWEIAGRALSQKPSPPIEQTPSTEESVTPVMPVKNKTRVKKRAAAAQSEIATSRLRLHCRYLLRKPWQ